MVAELTNHSADYFANAINRKKHLDMISTSMINPIGLLAISFVLTNVSAKQLPDLPALPDLLELSGVPKESTGQNHHTFEVSKVEENSLGSAKTLKIFDNAQCSGTPSNVEFGKCLRINWQNIAFSCVNNAVTAKLYSSLETCGNNANQPFATVNVGTGPHCRPILIGGRIKPYYTSGSCSNGDDQSGGKPHGPTIGAHCSPAQANQFYCSGSLFLQCNGGKWVLQNQCPGKCLDHPVFAQHCKSQQQVSPHLRACSKALNQCIKTQPHQCRALCGTDLKARCLEIPNIRHEVLKWCG
ncbi:hypothetical protein BC833DRAFT_587103, partial [Globomyces pollinis-pini]